MQETKARILVGSEITKEVAMVMLGREGNGIRDDDQMTKVNVLRATLKRSANTYDVV